MMRQRLDIVNSALQVPRCVHRQLRAQREAIQAFGVP
jgi:hypothetical protein